MKKINIILLTLSMMIYSSISWAAGSCTQSATSLAGRDSLVVKFLCTGDSSTGSIPDTAIAAATMTLLKQSSHFLYLVTAYPTSGGPAPDAADVSVLMNGTDLLGAKGVNLISATMKVVIVNKKLPKEIRINFNFKKANCLTKIINNDVSTKISKMWQ